MKIDDYVALLEAQSLDNMIKTHQDKIEEEHNRIISIENERTIQKRKLDEKVLCLKNYKELLSKNESELYKVENKLKKSKETINIVKSTTQLKALEKEITLFTPKRDKLEEDSLELMEKIETILSEIDDHKTFLEGSVNSLEKISKEVSNFRISENKEIELLQERITNLISIVPKEMQDIYQAISKKHKNKAPMAFVVDGGCTGCRFTIERSRASLLEKCTSLELCPNCERILTPNSAKSSLSS